MGKVYDYFFYVCNLHYSDKSKHKEAILINVSCDHTEWRIADEIIIIFNFTRLFVPKKEKIRSFYRREIIKYEDIQSQVQGRST